MRKKAEIKQEKAVKVYCGPDIRGVIRSFTAFDTIPTALKNAAEECPAVNAFIVPVSEIAEMRMKLRISGSSEQIISKKITDYFNKKGR